MISITEFHRTRNGDDWTPALNYLSSAVTEIYFPAGVYLFKSPPKPFELDVRLISDGSVAANDSSGVLLVSDYNDGDFLTWNGGVPTTAGGGLDRIKIAKGAGKSGGNGISLVAQTADKRCSSWLARDVMVHTSGYGRFDCNLNVDGSKVQTSGSAGVRGVRIDGARFAGALKANIRIAWAVSFQARGLETYSNGQDKGNRIEVSDSSQVLLDGSMETPVYLKRVVKTHIGGYVYQVTADNKSAFEVSAFQMKPIVIE
jgi:hypothetical protein